MPSDQGSRLSQGLLGGFLIVVGAALLTERIGLADLGAYWRYWPLVLVAIGVGRFLAPGPDDSPHNAFWFVFLGFLFLAHNLHWLRLARSWPLFLVVVGGEVAWRALRCAPAVEGGEVRHDS